LDGTQTCGDLLLMPGTSAERAKLGRATCSSTHVAIDLSLKNNDGSAPLASQQNLPAEITSRCKQCEETFTISIGEQLFFVQKAMSTPARCTRCRRWNRSKAPNKPRGDIPKGSSDSRFREALTSWAWWVTADLWLRATSTPSLKSLKRQALRRSCDTGMRSAQSGDCVLPPAGARRYKANHRGIKGEHWAQCARVRR